MKTIANITKIAVCAFAFTLAVSCGEKKCVINGTIDLPEGAQGVIVAIGERPQMDTIAVTDGKFQYECAVDPTVSLAVIGSFDGQTREQRRYTTIIPDAAKINVTLADESKVEGSPLTDVNKAVMEKVNAAETEEEYLEILKSAYTENCDNAIGISVFRNLAYELGLEEFDELFEKGCEKIKSNESYAKLREGKVNAAKTGVGCEYADFAGKTPEGADVKLSDFVGKGKYTLVDFWASWCGPCMRSMPGMVNLWNNYHKKGLDIVGVAVWDGDNSASRVKMEEKGMLWPQIFAGEDKTPTDIYGIYGIPHVILFDPEGIVIQRGIPDEEQLAEKIADLLK